ncbi:hypothetical protein SAVIM338S_00082 [Streptomyces avidinii]
MSKGGERARRRTSPADLERQVPRWSAELEDCTIALGLFQRILSLQAAGTA